MLPYGSVVEVERDTNSTQTGSQLRKKTVPHQQHGLAQVPDSLPGYEPGYRYSRPFRRDT